MTKKHVQKACQSCKKPRPIPTTDRFGYMSETFLTCENGVVKVKDGRTLEEYINDPRLVERRKRYTGPMVICSESIYERGIISQMAG